MEIYSRFTVILAVLLALSFPVFGYDIQGTVSVSAPYPKAQKIPVDQKYSGACPEDQSSQSLVVSPQGFLKNAVIFLDGDFREKFVSDLSTPTLDQKNCKFEPHVLIVGQDSPYFIANSDPIVHDIRAFDEAKMLYKFEIDPGSPAVEQKSNAPGTYVIRCGLHKWMHAFVISAKHPFYAVSNENGEFKLLGVPEGNYKIKIWHETLGESEVPIEVKQSISDFSYTFSNQ